MGLTIDERAVCEAIASRGEELVALASTLIAFDTTARNPGDPPREEAALQGFLAERLTAAGAEVDVFEPDAAAFAAIVEPLQQRRPQLFHPLTPDGASGAATRDTEPGGGSHAGQPN